MEDALQLASSYQFKPGEKECFVQFPVKSLSKLIFFKKKKGNKLRAMISSKHLDMMELVKSASTQSVA